MVPTAIVAGFVLGAWLRWWAVPLVALAWAAVIFVVAGPPSALGGFAVGAANAVVGVLPALGLRRLFDRSATGARPTRTR